MISSLHSVLLVHMQTRQGFMKSEMGVNRMTESVYSKRVRTLQGPLWRIACPVCIGSHNSRVSTINDIGVSDP